MPSLFHAPHLYNGLSRSLLHCKAYRYIQSLPGSKDWQLPLGRHSIIKRYYACNLNPRIRAKHFPTVVMTRVNQLSHSSRNNGIPRPPALLFRSPSCSLQLGVAGGGSESVLAPAIHATGEAARGWVNVTQSAMGIAQELNELKRLRFNLRNRQVEDHSAALGKVEMQYG